MGRTVNVRVLPEGPIDKVFDYLAPNELRDQVRVGSRVRVLLHGRRVGGWVVEVGTEPPAGVALKPLAKVTGHGPSADLVELAGWAAWRWAGRRAQLLATASPPAAVRSVASLPPTRSSLRRPAANDGWIADALSREKGVLRLGPLADRYPVVAAAVLDVLASRDADGPFADAGAPAGPEGAAARQGAGDRPAGGPGAANRRGDPGQLLVICPTVSEAVRLGRRLRRAGVSTATVADDGSAPSALAREWSRAAAGATAVVGSRAAAWAPAPRLLQAVVLDEHDDSYQQEQAPTWHARDVVAERCSRAGARCLLVSPCPSLEALGWGDLVSAPPIEELAQWPTLEIVDRRDEDPARAGLFSPRLVDMLRSDGRVVCVLNRVGRAKLLACMACGELARCDGCGASVEQLHTAAFRCRRCGTERPQVCLNCGSARFKNLRVGVSRAREELEGLVGDTVQEVSSGSDEGITSRVVVGTEAVLHRLDKADTVAFLDVDQELTAYRYRTTEQALALLARASRLLRASRGRLLVQTRQPGNLVLQAVARGDPARVAEAERPLRAAMRFPPTNALAVVSGAGAEAFIEAFGQPDGIEVLGPADGRWLLRAPDHQTLCDALAASSRPSGRLRIEVDPLGL